MKIDGNHCLNIYDKKHIDFEYVKNLICMSPTFVAKKNEKTGGLYRTTDVWKHCISYDDNDNVFDGLDRLICELGNYKIPLHEIAKCYDWVYLSTFMQTLTNRINFNLPNEVFASLIQLELSYYISFFIWSSEIEAHKKIDYKKYNKIITNFNVTEDDLINNNEPQDLEGNYVFVISNKSIDFEDIENRLELFPTEIIRCNDSKTNDEWLFQKKISSYEKMSDDLDEFLDLLIKNGNVIGEYVNSYDVKIICYFRSVYAQINFTLEPVILSKLISLNIPIEFDILSFGYAEN